MDVDVETTEEVTEHVNVSELATLKELAGAFAASWSSDTSASPYSWTGENMWLGQCAVTALVIQDYLGGEILRAVNGGESHYWNRLGPMNAIEVDFTRDQFQTWEPEGEPEVRGRNKILNNRETLRRYETLAARVEEHLNASDAGLGK